MRIHINRVLDTLNGYPRTRLTNNTLIHDITLIVINDENSLSYIESADKVQVEILIKIDYMDNNPPRKYRNIEVN